VSLRVILNWYTFFLGGMVGPRLAIKIGAYLTTWAVEVNRGIDGWGSG